MKQRWHLYHLLLYARQRSPQTYDLFVHHKVRPMMVSKDCINGAMRWDVSGFRCLVQNSCLRKYFQLQLSVHQLLFQFRVLLQLAPQFLAHVAKAKHGAHLNQCSSTTRPILQPFVDRALINASRVGGHREFSVDFLLHRDERRGLLNSWR